MEGGAVGGGGVAGDRVALGVGAEGGGGHGRRQKWRERGEEGGWEMVMTPKSEKWRRIRILQTLGGHEVHADMDVTTFFKPPLNFIFFIIKKKSYKAF